MSKRIIAGFTLFAFLSLGLPTVAEPSGVVVEKSVGSVSVRDDDSRPSLSPQADLELGRAVSVGQESQVTLLFPDGSRARIAPDSEFRLVSDSQGKPLIYLIRGRVISTVVSAFTVETFRSNAVATEGEFVVETDPHSTGLKVFSGNARLNPKLGQSKSYDLLGSTSAGSLSRRALLAFGILSSEQTVQGDEAEFGAQGKGKGAGIRKEREPEKTGGVGRVSPDQDILPPGRDPAAVVEPTTTTPPPTSTTTPPTTPTTTTTTTTTAASGGGVTWPYIVGGLAALGGGIALLTNNDSDEETFFQVPTASFP